MTSCRIYCLVIFLLVVRTCGYGQGLYRDWDRRVCPVLDTPYGTFEGISLLHVPGVDTGTVGWGDNVSVSDVNIWKRYANWENDVGGELELRGHADVRVLEGFEQASGIDRLHGFWMLRVVGVWHQRFRGGFGVQGRMQPGVYSSLGAFDGKILSVPVGVTLIQAFRPDLAVFAGVDYYPDFAVDLDPVLGVLYSRYNEIWLEAGYPRSRFSYRPYGGRLQFELGADFSRWPEYRLERDDERQSLQFRENRFYAGFSWDTRGFTRVDVKAGYMSNRRLDFREGGTIEFEDAPFVSIGFSGVL